MRVWKDVPGYPGYQASECGLVRSVDRIVVDVLNGATRKRTFRGRVLKMSKNKKRSEHRSVNLCVRGAPHTLYVHRIVMLTFVGPRPDGLEVRHANSDATDNRVSNLSYGTHAQNMADMAANGTSHKGERSPMAKLTEADVIAIRASRSTNKEVAQDYGICSSTVGQIRRRVRWGHVK